MFTDDTPRTSPACPAPDAVAVPQVYLPGVPFVPVDTVPMTDDDVRERAVSVTSGGDYVMFDKRNGTVL